MQPLIERIGALPPEKRAALAAQNPLSFAQMRLWCIDRLEGGGASYNVQALIPLPGAYDPAALKAALAALAERHAALRTVYPAFDGEPMQLVGPPPDIDIPFDDLAGIDKPDRRRRYREILAEDAARPFDLSAGPIYRARAVRVEPGRVVLLLVIHHIATDGWSQSILNRELTALYAAHRDGRPCDLPPLPLQYADFAQWQRQRLHGERLDELIAFWRRELDGVSPLDLPIDRPRPPMLTSRGAMATAKIGAETADRLRALARTRRATLFMTLLAAYHALLARYCGQHDFCIGTPVAGRNRPELEGLVGFFVNTLALRLTSEPDLSFADLVDRARRVILDAFDRQEMPFEKIVELLNPPRDTGRAPFVQTVFALQNTPEAASGIGASRESGLDVGDVTTRFELELHVWEENGGLTCVAFYSTDLFDESTIHRLLGHWERLLSEAAQDPGRRLCDYPLVGDLERRELTETFNATARPYPREATIHGLFEERAATRPDAVALEYRNFRMTYGELDGEANALARLLIESGVERGGHVGLMVNRSPDMAVSLLAILKAGAAYLPLDPEYPRARLARLIADARPRLILAAEAYQARLPEGAPVLGVDRARARMGSYARTSPQVDCGAEDLAYTMFTSGSTGEPKGVCVTHRNVVRLVRNADYVELGPETATLILAPLAFDASTFEWWAPLLNGGRVALFPPELPSLSELKQAVARHRVNTLWLTAGLFHQFVQEDLSGLTGVTQLLAGGDVLRPEAVRRALSALPGCAVINGYGPTECTTFSACCRMTDAEEVGDPVPIGRPIANTRTYVLDARGEPVPAGVYGELYIGGDGVARGYLNSPELTAARFVADPFSPEAGARMYRTGDVARWLPDGRLEFRGRRDGQVKLRGYRIELGEIEAALSAHPAVAHCAAVLREDVPGDKRIAAYVVQSADADPESFRAYLRDQLPSYMIPSSFTSIESIPLTANGKRDLSRLPAPAAAISATLVEPRTPLEAEVLAIWREALPGAELGVETNFFDVGGNSLLLIQLAAKANAAFAVDLPLQHFFAEPTAAAMARTIDALRSNERPVTAPAAEEDGYGALLIPLRAEGSAYPLFCIPPAGGTAFPYYNLAHALGPDHPVYALRDPSVLDNGRCLDSLEAMGAAYAAAIRTRQPRGPYHLTGWSFGGIAALETARSLRSEGDDVALLAVIEAVLPAPNRRTWAAAMRSLPRTVLSTFRSMRAGAAVTLDGYQAALEHLRRHGGAGGPKGAMGLFIRFRDGLMWSLFLRRTAMADLLEENAHLTLIRQPMAAEFSAVMKGNLKAYRRYRAAPYDGPVLVVHGDDQPDIGAAAHPAQGWDAVAGNHLEIAVVRGNHFSIIRNPHVVELAAALAQRISQRA